MERTHQSEMSTVLGNTALLVSCSHSILRVDPFDPDSCHITATGEGLYYGLAKTDKDHAIWAAARNALVSEGGPTSCEAGSIINIANPRLESVSRRLVPKSPLRDLHGIGIHAAALWATCSYDDAVAIYDFDNRSWAWWTPRPLAPDSAQDQFHYNTLMFEDDLVWVLAHRKGPSWLMSFNVKDALAGKTTAPVSLVELGHQAHNMWRQDSGELCTCSSIEGVLVGERGWRLETGGFPRGVVRVPGGWVVGVSELKERSERDFSDAKLIFFDSAWRPLRTMTLPQAGMVLDIMTVPSSLPLPVVGTLPLVAG